MLRPYFSSEHPCLLFVINLLLIKIYNCVSCHSSFFICLTIHFLLPLTSDKPEKPSVDIRNFIPFSGKGHMIGQNSSSAAGSSSSQSSKTSTGATSSVTSGNQRNDRSDKESSSGPSSFFGKKFSGTNATNSATRQTGKASNTSRENATVTQFSNNTSQKTMRNDEGVDLKKKPRFTPVVATASGHPVHDRVGSGFSSDSGKSGRQTTGSESESSPQRTQRKFVPVVAAAGRKESASSVISVDNTPSSTIPSNQHKDLAHNKLKTSSSNSSGKSSNKRARLVDLQTIFDSDSDEDHPDAKSSKIPRYALDDSDDDAVIVSNDVTGNTSFGSDKENRGSADVFIEEDSDDDDGIVGSDGRITTGIWKDLSHSRTTSTNSSRTESGENSRFGRVPPPLWGKSSNKSKRGNQVPTMPQSSFCEHPWQTAAREGANNSRQDVGVTAGNRVINLEDNDGGGG